MNKFILRFVSLFVIATGWICASAAVGDVYIRVDSDNSLHSGDRVIVASADNMVCMSRYVTAAYVKPCSLSIAGNGRVATLPTDSVQTFVLDRKGGAWHLHAEDKGWLYAPSVYGSTLEYAESASTAANTRKSTMLDIEIDGEGNAIAEFRVSDYSFLKYKSDTRRFARYRYSDSHSHIQIYRKAATNRRFETMAIGENGGNGEILDGNADAMIGMLRIGRTLRADGGLYSVCLPVAVSAKEMETVFKDARFYRMASVEGLGESGLLFRFERVRMLAAGVPYLVRPIADVENPVLADCLISATAPASLSFDTSIGKCRFVGLFDPAQMIPGGNRLFVGQHGDRLVTPSQNGQLKGLRAYIELETVPTSAGLAVGDVAANSRVLLTDSKDESAVTGLRITEPVVQSSVLFTVDGVRVGGSDGVSCRGLYVYKGKKFLRK